MEISTNLGFYLPSSASDDIADINQISDNFRNLDEYIPGMFREVKADVRTKQDVLVSGENIKSVNGKSLLGEGDLELSVEVDQVFNAKSKNAQSGVAIANTFSNALKGNKSGEIVSMNDVSPIEHNVGVKVKSKNNFKPFIKNYNTTQNGVTITVEQGKSVVLLNGTATSNTQRALFMSIQNFIELKAGQTYCLSAKSIGGVVGDCTVTLNDSTSTILASLKLGNSAVYAPTKDISAYISLHAISGAVFENAEIVWQLEEGTTATAITPFVEDLTAVSVKKQGENLFNINAIPNTDLITNNGDGTLSVAPNSYACFTGVKLSQVCPLLKVGDVVYLSGKTTGVAWIVAGVQWNYNSKATITQKMLDSVLIVYGTREGDENHGLPITISNIQIEYGGITEYEPFVEPTTYTPNENGIVEGVTSLYPSMTLTTDTSGVIIDAEYNRDINKAFAELQNAVIYMGGIL